MDRGTDIYFAVSQTGLVKVGRSSNVAGRIEALRCPDGGKVRLVASFRGIGGYEKTIHRALADTAQGGEWFSPSELAQRLARADSGSDVLDILGVKRRGAGNARLANDKDREDFTKADQLIREGQLLRRRVNGRLRARAFRNARREGNVEGL